MRSLFVIIIYEFLFKTFLFHFKGNEKFPEPFASCTFIVFSFMFFLRQLTQVFKSERQKKLTKDF